MRGLENCSRPTQVPYFGRVWKLSTTFSTRNCCQNWKKILVQFFYRPQMKVELTRENGRNTSNTGSKGYLWLLVRRSHGIASETLMLSVRAVWLMPSVTGCHGMNTPIRKAKPNISDRGTSRYNSAASFNEENPRKKQWALHKICSKALMTWYKLSTPWQISRKLGFEKKKWRLCNWRKFLNNFDQFRQQWTRLIFKHCPYALWHIICELKCQYCYT